MPYGNGALLLYGRCLPYLPLCAFCFVVVIFPVIVKWTAKQMVFSKFVITINIHCYIEATLFTSNCNQYNDYRFVNFFVP